MKTIHSALLALALCVCVSCGKPTVFVARDQGTSSEASRSHGAGSSSSEKTRDLTFDEGAGGHTLARHVGKTDDELRERLSREHIAAASTYTDRAMAERTVGAALASGESRIRSWSDSRGGHPNLVLDYDAPQPIGRTLHRNESTSVPCSHAVVVLKWKPPTNYYVLTSYPECR